MVAKHRLISNRAKSQLFDKIITSAHIVSRGRESTATCRTTDCPSPMHLIWSGPRRAFDFVGGATRWCQAHVKDVIDGHGQIATCSIVDVGGRLSLATLSLFCFHVKTVCQLLCDQERKSS